MSLDSTNTIGTAGTSIGAQCGKVAAGTQAQSGDVNTLVQSIENDLATISTGNCTIAGTKTFSGTIHCAQTKGITADGTGCTLAGTWTVSGNVSFAGGSVGVHEDFNFHDDSRAFLVGRVIPRSARVAVADGNKTIGVTTGAGVDYAGKRFVVVSSPGSARTITLDHSHTSPSEGETMEVLCVALTGSTTQYSFVREDATLVATFTAPAGIAHNRFNWVEFEFVSGVWRMGANNGASWDPIGTAAYGVLGGAGA